MQEVTSHPDLRWQFSNVNVHENPLQGLLKYALQGLSPVFLTQKDLHSSKSPGAADVFGQGCFSLAEIPCIGKGSSFSSDLGKTAGE